MYKLTVLINEKHREKLRDMRENLSLKNEQIIEKALEKLENDGEILEKLEDLDRKFDQLTSHLAFFQKTYSEVLKKLNEN